MAKFIFRKKIKEENSEKDPKQPKETEKEEKPEKEEKSEERAVQAQRDPGSPRDQGAARRICDRTGTGKKGDFRRGL